MSIHNVTPPCASAAHSHGIEDKGLRKRPWTDSLATDIDKRPLIIQTDPSNPFAKPHHFTPICLLARAHLPLVYLDTALSGSRLFTAHVNLLEACQEVSDSDKVLVARNDTESRLYAVERVDRHKYALCRLATWVQPYHISQQVDGRVQWNTTQQKRLKVSRPEGEQSWYDSARVQMPEIPHDRTQTQLKKPEICMTIETISDPLLVEDLAKDVIQMSPSIMLPETTDDKQPDVTSDPVPPTTQTGLEELAKQYLETLFLSRTSLAYFSKGPLSRARAAFSGNGSSDLQPSDLVEFLRGALLSSSTMDKKYREGIPELIHELPAESSSKPKKKRKWKPKRSKAGYFVDEKSYVEQWWRKCDALNATETTDTSLRGQMPRLRNREAFLQVILLLEIIALESAIKKQDGLRPPAELHDMSQTDALGSVTEKKASKKKELDVNDMLESQLDRLCIWHSIGTTSPSKSEHSDQTKDDANDSLKNFTLEVIIPFYMSRIPQQAAMVSKKFGGPDVSSPAGRKPSSHLRKPGEPAPRQAPERRARKPLERVATDINSKAKHPPMLHRSATDSDALAPLIKREYSESAVTLGSVPPVRSRLGPSAPSRRASVMQQISSSKREVDFAAVADANSLKIRKKAEVDAKLREAISALKKPNRGLATEDLARSMDESFAKMVAKRRGRGDQSAERNHMTVTATPSHVAATPARRRTRPSFVPSSASRPSAAADVPSSTGAIPETGHRVRLGLTKVEETPSRGRGFARYMPLGLARVPGDSPTRANSIMQTPMRAIQMPPLEASPISASATRNDQGTPVNLLGASLVRKALGKGETSIYDALGWDEDVENLA